MIKNVETGINEIDKEGKVDVISLKEEEIKGENKTTSVDLRSKEFLEKKRQALSKKDYDLNDSEIKIVKLDNDLIARLITNNKGVFVDFRRYYKGFPTRRGIRLSASIFTKISKILEEDINRLIPNLDKF